MFLITDFGDSVEASYDKRYQPIEQLLLHEPHPSFDIWALGIIIYRLLTGKEPYSGESDQSLLEAI